MLHSCSQLHYDFLISVIGTTQSVDFLSIGADIESALGTADWTGSWWFGRVSFVVSLQIGQIFQDWIFCWAVGLILAIEYVVRHLSEACLVLAGVLLECFLAEALAYLFLGEFQLILS